MSVKQALQKHLHDRNVKQYEKQLNQEKKKIEESYQTIVDMLETKQKELGCISIENAKVEMDEITIIPYCLCDADVSALVERTKYILFAREQGSISKNFLQEMKAQFQQQELVTVIYSHEDLIDESKERDGAEFCRVNPWIKPIWSPDTLLSFFYLGNMFAVRGDDFRKCQMQWGNNSRKNLYGLVLELTAKQKKAWLIDEVSYHGRLPYEDKVGCTKDFADLKISVYQGLGFDSRCKEDEYGICHVHPIANNPKISILIPTKDHPEILRRCVSSIRKMTEKTDYEILVMDNGSSQENMLQYEMDAKTFSYDYFYSPMEFNFSKMCNTLANSAKGEFFLFLNDDMEIFQTDWLELLVGTAALSHVGAVGAKLYYPGSTQIQHVGISNLSEGPVHKIQGEDDKQEFYFGVNRLNRDMIGVTAACLMIQKNKFREIGGFFEGLKVAYNDVDLNYKLLEKGYYNVLLNDVVLYHHESLSRGNDMLSDEKRKRLKEENYVLYNRNPLYYGKDPFYGSYMTGVSNAYEIAYPQENRMLSPISKWKEQKKEFHSDKRNEALIISVDIAEQDRNKIIPGKETYLIDLHAHVRGMDSADYRFTMFLVSEQKCFKVPYVRRYRQDVEKTLYNEIHVELSGFAVRIPEDLIPVGDYEIWMEAKSLCSRQVLWNKADVLLKVL